MAGCGGGSDAPPSCSAGYVALTFDDGPTATTSKLLEALARGHLRVTFFDVGQEVQHHPAYAVAERRAGHNIGNHTQSHHDLSGVNAEVVRNELLTAQRALGAPRLFRPPFGHTSALLEQVVRELGLTMVFWTVDPEDWRNGPPDRTVQRVGAKLHAQDVVLLHDGQANTVLAIPGIAKLLRQRGLCAGELVPSTRRTQVWPGVSHAVQVVPWSR